MPEPVTLAVVATSVVTEGIKFLYGQAAEAVKRWRESPKDAGASQTAPAKVTPPPQIFDGPLEPLNFHLGQVERLEKELLILRSALTDQANGLASVNTNDRALLETIDAFRQAMEAVYQQRLTFVGEQRPRSGPVVEGTIDVPLIAGTAAAIRARLIASGKVVGRVKADRIESGASAYGVDVDTIGGHD
jgi:hypothetical protein